MFSDACSMGGRLSQQKLLSDYVVILTVTHPSVQTLGLPMVPEGSRPSCHSGRRGGGSKGAEGRQWQGLSLDEMPPWNRQASPLCLRQSSDFGRWRE